MAEMRQLVGVLREADGQLDPTTPAPGLDDLPALFTGLRAAGLGVDYRVEGSPIEVPAAVGMSTYRIVQEALTNVIKHGGPVATVTIRADAAAMHVDVHDNGAPAGSRRVLGGTDVPAGGHGLVGMRERVSVFGGELTAGPRPGGGFGITAILPVGGLAISDRRTPGPTSQQRTGGEMVPT
jgi:signal transduction histidine kinase